jgi:hypothetical protein
MVFGSVTPATNAAWLTKSTQFVSKTLNAPGTAMDALRKVLTLLNWLGEIRNSMRQFHTVPPSYLMTARPPKMPSPFG